MRSLVLGLLLTAGLTCGALAQTPVSAPEAPPEYVPPTVIEMGTAPGLKVTEFSPKIRSFQLVFANGDDVQGGLEDFAKKNHIEYAHFTGYGALGSTVIGWGDPGKNRQKIFRINEEAEIGSFVGDIMHDRQGQLEVHTHIAVGLLRNGAVYAGHLQQGRVSITLIVHMDAYDPISETSAK